MGIFARCRGGRAAMTARGVGHDGRLGHMQTAARLDLDAGDLVPSAQLI